jgi:hypothetical protein
MAAGPVDVVGIGFPGNTFTGRIVPAITELVDSGTIPVLDMLFVMKDADANLTTIEVEDLAPDTGPATCPSRSQNRGARRGGHGRDRREPAAEQLGPASGV